MPVSLELMDTFERPEDDDTPNKAVLTDGMTYIEFKLTSDDISIEKNSYELDVDADLTETDKFDIVNSSTNESLPSVIPRLRMPTPIIIRVGIIFRIPEDTVINESEIEFSLIDTETQNVEDTQKVVFTEVVSSSEEPESVN